MTCSCGRIVVGSEVTENRNLDYDCPEHGLKSAWWNSPEQVEKRRQDNNRLRDLQQQARDARKTLKDTKHQKAVTEQRATVEAELHEFVQGLNNDF